MYNLRKTSIIIIILFTLGVIILKILPLTELTTCTQFDIMRSIEFNGKVIKKYYDKEDHFIPFVEILEKQNIEKIGFISESGGMFEFLNVGDSVVKMINNDTVFIVRDNLVFIKALKYDCDKSGK